MMNYPYGPGCQADAASIASAEKVMAVHRVICLRILEILQENEYTCDEIAWLTGRNLYLIRPAMSALKVLRRVCKTGIYRNNGKGRNTNVWRIRRPEESDIDVWKAAQERRKQAKTFRAN